MAAAAAMASSAARSRQREDGCLHIHREKRTGEKRVEGGGGGEGARRDRVEEYYTCRCSGVLTPNSFFNVT